MRDDVLKRVPGRIAGKRLMVAFQSPGFLSFFLLVCKRNYVKSGPPWLIQALDNQPEMPPVEWSVYVTLETISEGRTGPLKAQEHSG